MAELRATITLLRSDDGDPPREPAPGLAQLGDLIRRVDGAGAHVAVESSADLPALPPALELTAYRVVQEALTKVIRHAQADSALVDIRHDRSTLTIRVDDDGRGVHGSEPVEGYGW